MLSKKQLWRKAPRSLLPFEGRDELIPSSPRTSKPQEPWHTEPGFSMERNPTITPPSSPRSVSLNGSKISPVSRSGSEVKLWYDVSLPPKKKISFCPTVKVRLIPTRQETSFLNSSLYWSSSECEAAARESMEEIETFSRLQNCPMRVATTLLYQPEFDPDMQPTKKVPLAVPSVLKESRMNVEEETPENPIRGGLWLLLHSH